MVNNLMPYFLSNPEILYTAPSLNNLGSSSETRIIVPSVSTNSKCVDLSFNSNFLYELYPISRSEEHTSELQSRENLVCRLLLEKKKSTSTPPYFSFSLMNF